MTETKPNSLTRLAGHLTDSQDRETYAALISYMDSLPPGDEISQLAQLLGFLSLLGQRVPDALAKLLAELREQTAAAAEYHSKVDERLAHLPGEIAAGVDPAAMAKAISESFRQQIAASGLRDTAVLLNQSAAEVKGLYSQIAATLKPVIQQCTRLSGTITEDLDKLRASSIALQEHNSRLIIQEPQRSWVLLGTVALVLFLVGGVSGIIFEKGQMAALIRSVQIQQVRTEMPTVAAAVLRKKRR